MDQTPAVNRGTVRWGRVGWFYTLSWAGMLACAALFAVLEGTGLRSLVLVAAMWTPGVSALLLTWRSGEPMMRGLGLSIGRWRWLVASVAAPVALYGLMLGWGLVLPGVIWASDNSAILDRIADQLSPEQVEMAREQLEALPLPVWLIALAEVIPGAVLNVPAALGEELGWRGLMHAELEPLGPGRASLLTGALWGFWHAPLIVQGYNFPSHPWVGVLVMIAGCMALSPLMTLLRQRSGSVVSAALFHGGLNAGGQVLIMALAGHELVVHPIGLVGILAGLTAAVGCAFAWRRAVSGR